MRIMIIAVILTVLVAGSAFSQTELSSREVKKVFTVQKEEVESKKIPEWVILIPALFGIFAVWHFFDAYTEFEKGNDVDGKKKLCLGMVFLTTTIFTFGMFSLFL